MADDDQSTDELAGDNLASEAGVIAEFPTTEDFVFSVAPTNSGKVNTLRKALRPSACWRIDDLRFHFDSSFILPDACREFSLLASLRSPSASGEAALLLSVFGHADPSGADDYNKTLAGRRATSVYALLVRDGALWEELYSTPAGGDAWSIAQIQIMLQQLGKTSVTNSGVLDPPTTAGVKEFQADNGLAQDGIPGPDTRKTLFLQYMDAICQDANGPFQYQASDFVSKGASADGKADRQGCSEFNPILVFSQDQAKEFEDPSKKAERDADNLSNRRVVVYLFSPSLPIAAARWPCPTVKEGVGGCKSQFFPDGDTRRNPQEQQRQYLMRGRTFACKFYDQIARSSPCEAVRQNMQIFLLGADGLPSTNAPYRLTTGSQIRNGVTDGSGVLFEPQVLAGLTCKIEWGTSSDTPTSPIFPNYAEILLNTMAEDDADSELAKRQLFNLGYWSDDDSVNRQNFQAEYSAPDNADSTVNTAHSTGQAKQQRILG